MTEWEKELKEELKNYGVYEQLSKICSDGIIDVIKFEIKKAINEVEYYNINHLFDKTTEEILSKRGIK